MNMKHIGLVSCVGVLLLCAFIGMASVTISSAEVVELNAPSVVVQGETLSISGKASPYEEVCLKSSFAISLPVSNERYSRDFIGIDFPEGEKVFSVTAENIKNIRVSLSPVFWQTVTITCSGQTMTITFPGGTITRPLEESIDERGVVSFSISFPVSIGPVTLDIKGKKDIAISGDAAEDATSVNLNVATSIKVTADSNGDFTLDINTGGVPFGEFLITAGGIEKTVEVVSEEQTPTPTPSPSPTPTPSSNGGDGDDTPGTTPTPTPSPIPSPSPSPSPTLSPSPLTSPSPTPALTTTPTPSAPAPTPSPTPSPSSSKRRIPGFEAIFAIAGLLAVAYLVLRKRE